MARKKKTESKPVEPVEEQPVDQENLEDACFIPFENGFMASETPTVSETEETVSTTKGVETDKPLTDYEQYAVKISHAFDVIEKCNLYMWAGLDWGTGRIYEMARKEWANYILAMYEWSDNGFKGVEPEKPSEVA